ncbi:hypothetical protein [Pseudobacillus wudalianchiensis]|uniref:Uncharacterized protein n=1 Tax=Pseudobacillus wudalianchiensis TaxID=1743143 RepID=A0A1B9ATJ6_9BACI|nr:hypothetical protein [Bacillus wudalianchiensis]OCA87154.1 hypothetical protein A8F95_07750 [Bacillus wudalianchiensis]
MQQTQNLSELTELVKSEKGNIQLCISQQEKSSSGISLGDEDTGGADQEIEVKILMEAAKKAIVFEKVYNQSIEYEEAIKQIKALEQAFPLQKMSVEEIEKRIQTIDQG